MRFSICSRPLAILVAADFLSEVVELLEREIGLLADLLERFAGLREFRRAAGQLREQRAERRAFVARLVNEGLQVVLLLLLLVGAGAEDGIKHIGAIIPTRRPLASH